MPRDIPPGVTSDHVNDTPDDPKYGDFLLIDILRPDFKHFFSRYRVDLIGFVIISLVIVFIILATKWLAMIGTSVSRGGGG